MGSATLGEVPFFGRGGVDHQQLDDDEGQDGIAQQLQHLIVAQGSVVFV